MLNKRRQGKTRDTPETTRTKEDNANRDNKAKQEMTTANKDNNEKPYTMMSSTT